MDKAICTLCNLEHVAVEVLRGALTHDEGARLIGNVTAHNVARLAVALIRTCPQCGAEAWTNIDCHLCALCSELEEP